MLTCTPHRNVVHWIFTLNEHKINTVDLVDVNDAKQHPEKVTSDNIIDDNPTGKGLLEQGASRPVNSYNAFERLEMNQYVADNAGNALIVRMPQALGAPVDYVIFKDQQNVHENAQIITIIDHGQQKDVQAIPDPRKYGY